MSTRSAAAASSSSSSRKRRSTSGASAESPAKRRTTRAAGSGASAAPVADPSTLVPVASPAGGWCASMRPAREAGEFIDITLIVGDRKIPAHKTVLVGLSPYIEGLLTSGLAESQQGGDTLKIGDEDTDGHAVEAIVDCFYSGELSLSNSTVSSVIRTANLLGVCAAEKAACDFFVESIEPSTACEALAFATAHSVCGEHARGLHEVLRAVHLQRDALLHQRCVHRADLRPVLRDEGRESRARGREDLRLRRVKRLRQRHHRVQPAQRRGRPRRDERGLVLRGRGRLQHGRRSRVRRRGLLGPLRAQVPRLARRDRPQRRFLLLPG